MILKSKRYIYKLEINIINWLHNRILITVHRYTAYVLLKLVSMILSALMQLSFIGFTEMLAAKIHVPLRTWNKRPLTYIGYIMPDYTE